MRITQITYGKTINIGNYQSIRVDFTAEVESNEHPLAILQDLKTIVASAEIDILKENAPLARR